MAGIRDLMRSGVVKQSDKPIWTHFMPDHWPRCMGRKKRLSPDSLPGTGPRAFDLSKCSFVSTCQRFVEKYTEFERQKELEKQSLFEETGKALLAEGLVLRRKGIPAVAPETRDPVLGMKLTYMLAEQRQMKGLTSTPIH
uniref:Small ribosomal subunit protein mS23 conserved domain-containing protein n=1 Tax=Hucho hucho TaxID=62062 RepID=A0A4W5NWG1_9TELE